MNVRRIGVVSITIAALSSIGVVCYWAGAGSATRGSNNKMQNDLLSHKKRSVDPNSLLNSSNPVGRMVKRAPLTKKVTGRMSGLRTSRQSHLDTDRGAPDLNLPEAKQLMLSDLKNPNADLERLQEALVLIAEQDDTDSLDLIRRTAEAASQPDLQILAMNVLTEHPGPENLGVIRLGLNSADEEVRLATATLLALHYDPEVHLLWESLVTDSSPEIAQTLFDNLVEAPTALQLRMAKAALSTTQPWLREQAILTLGGVVDKAAVEVLLPLLDDPVSGDLVHDGLMFLLGESFLNRGAAKKWWAANKDLLDAELQPKDLSPDTPPVKK